MVKDYYSLTEEEKKLLRDYELLNQGNDFAFLLVYIGCLAYFMVFLLGFFYDRSDFVGVGILGMMLMQMTLIWLFKKIKKTNRLIFGFNNANKYFFDIDKKDEKIKIKELITPDKEG